MELSRSLALRSRAVRPGSASRSSKKASSFAKRASQHLFSYCPSRRPKRWRRRLSNGLVPTVYTTSGIAAAERAAKSVAERAAKSAAKSAAESVGSSAAGLVDVHLKVDTGMHRVGADPDETVALARAVGNSPHLRLGSVWTHLAVAEGLGEEDRSFTREQIRRYEEVLSRLASAGVAVPLRHAANTAGTIVHPDIALRHGQERNRDLRRAPCAGARPASRIRRGHLAPGHVAQGPRHARPGARRRRTAFVRQAESPCRRLGRRRHPSGLRRRSPPGVGSIATAPCSWVGNIDRLPVR